MAAPNSETCLIADGPAFERAGLIHRVREPERSGLRRTVVMLHGRSGDENVMWVFARAVPADWLVLAPRGLKPDLIYRWRRGPTPDPSITATPFPGRRWRTELIETYGPPEENPEFWNSISANAFLTDLSGPLQLHHGTADTSVPLEFSETLYQQVLAAGQTVEFYSYAGADHNLAISFSLAMQRTLEFFNTYVKGP